VYIGLHVANVPVILVRLNFLGRFSKNLQLSNWIQIRPGEAALFHSDGQTDMTKLTVAFRNFTNSPKKDVRINLWLTPHVCSFGLVGLHEVKGRVNLSVFNEYHVIRLQVSMYAFLIGWRLSGQFHAPADLPSEKSPWPHCLEGWLGLEVGVDTAPVWGIESVVFQHVTWPQNRLRCPAPYTSVIALSIIFGRWSSLLVIRFTLNII
jgi:hypothetical protein